MYFLTLLSISVSDSERINEVLGGTFVASDAGLYAEISVADIPSTNPLIYIMVYCYFALPARQNTFHLWFL